MCKVEEVAAEVRFNENAGSLRRDVGGAFKTELNSISTPHFVRCQQFLPRGLAPIFMNFFETIMGVCEERLRRPYW